MASRANLPQPAAAPGGARAQRAPWHRWLYLAILVATSLAFVAGFQRWRTSRARGGFEVAPEAYSIYLLGSSTAQGYPYFPRVNLGKIARLLVGSEIDGRNVRVVNLAGPGKTARVVLQDARDLVHHAPPRDRSLVFLYIGNNEFTRLDRRHDLRHSERTLFDVGVVSPAEKQHVETQYAATLEVILGTVQDAGLPVVASTIAVNFKDWEPNRSVLQDPAHADSMRVWLASGDRQFEAGEAAEALAQFERALALEPHFALAAKRAGDCCRMLHRTAAARRYYQAAIDDDGNPLRETSTLDRALRQVCARRRVPLFDAAAVLAAASPDTLLGFELLWDNCHPTLAGYELLARSFVTLLDSLHAVSPQPLSAGEIDSKLGIDGDFERHVLNMEGQYFYGASTLTFDPKARLARARLYLERADALGADADVAASLAVLAALEGNRQASLDQWRRALGLDRKVADERLQNAYVKQIMGRLGVADVAKALR